MDAKSTTTVQSLDRAFLLIELLSRYPQGVSLAEISSNSGLAKATVSRLLATLIQNSYVVQNPDSKKYRLTMRMFEIGSRVVGGANLLSIAKPYLETLSSITGDAVHLVSRVNDEVVYLYKEEASTSVVRRSSCVGLRNPMYCVGVGKAIMAFLPEEEVHAIWQRITPVQFTPTTITTEKRMREELDRIRRIGYAVDNEEHELGVRCIAAPILDINGSPIAAISISAPIEDMTEAKIQEYAPLILVAANKISRYYGAK